MEMRCGLAELWKKLQWCSKHDRKSKQDVAEVPKLLVEESWPKSIRVKKAIVNRSVQVVTAQCSYN